MTARLLDAIIVRPGDHRLVEYEGRKMSRVERQMLIDAVGQSRYEEILLQGNSKRRYANQSPILKSSFLKAGINKACDA